MVYNQAPTEIYPNQFEDLLSHKINIDNQTKFLIRDKKDLEKNFQQTYNNICAVNLGYWESKKAVKESKEMQKLQKKFTALKQKIRENQELSKEIKTILKGIQIERSNQLVKQ